MKNKINLTNSKRINASIKIYIENLDLIIKRTSMSKRKLSLLIGRSPGYIRDIRTLSFITILQILDILEIPLEVFGMSHQRFIKYICAPENSDRIIESVKRKDEALKNQK